MPDGLAIIGFDADDTLWHNETYFKLTEARFAEILADFATAEHLGACLLQAERRNLARYGFGIKGFTLSMIETALEVTDHRVSGDVIAQIVAMGRDMLAHPVELLPHVEATLTRLADRYPLVLITKGDLLHQEQKLAASGLGEMFAGVHIVSDKTPDTYRDAFGADRVAQAMMVGNSMKSDVVPALEAGAWGVHVPHDLAWALEHADTPHTHPRFRDIPDLSGLPDLIDALSGHV